MRHFIVFCHLRWDFVLQRPQHVLSRLAKHYKVVLVEEPLKSNGAPRLEVTSPANNIDVLKMHTPHEDFGFTDDQFAAMRVLVGDYLQQRSITDYVVLFYTPMALPLLWGLRPRAVVYDCMDELSTFKNAPESLCARENDLLGLADVVFTGGPSLYEAKRDRHPNVLCLPSAVDAKHYARERAVSDKDAMDRAAVLQNHIASPRLGFFGVIDERLDIELIDRLGAADPDWQIVMVGPVAKISPDDLPRRPNIHWLGQQSYGLLPQLVAGWDVCLLPFALNASTRFISPTKTLEYMAAEKPIVSTPVRDVALLYGRDIRIAKSAEDFVQACCESLDEPLHVRLERNARMLDTVAHYSWDNTAERMRLSIERAIASREQPVLQAA